MIKLLRQRYLEIFCLRFYVQFFMFERENILYIHIYFCVCFLCFSKINKLKRIRFVWNMWRADVLWTVVMYVSVKYWSEEKSIAISIWLKIYEFHVELIGYFCEFAKIYVVETWIWEKIKFMVSSGSILNKYYWNIKWKTPTKTFFLPKIHR